MLAHWDIPMELGIALGFGLTAVGVWIGQRWEARRHRQR